MAERMTDNYRQRSLPVYDSSHCAEARRTALRLVGESGFEATDSGNVAIIVTELATNLLKHAKRGEILVRSLSGNAVLGAEFIALDRGPGIPNIARCLQDGYSTSGSAGTGLGSIARLASDFDVHSLPGKGTAVFVRVWPGRKKPEKRYSLEVGVVSLPKAGEEICGDDWKCELLADKSLCLVADGLGHGPNAAVAASRATEILIEHRTKTPAEIIERAHAALRSTRGAALGVAQIDDLNATVRYCGIGNIVAAVIADGKSRQLVSLNGTAGLEVPKVVEFTHPWGSDSTLILHSDGLASRWDLQLYPGLIQRHPSLIAGVLYRDFNRNRDDVTVLVAKPAESIARRNTPWLIP
jgi:anti-sigma regulatory factor (Ser/Thr protein kinase)